MSAKSEKEAAMDAMKALIFDAREKGYGKRNGLQTLFNYCAGDMTKVYYQNKALDARAALNELGEADPNERIVFDYLDGTVLFYENVADGTIL